MNSPSAPLGILLGASNLRRGLTTAVAEARRRLGCDARLALALGHGRSYAMESTVLVRRLPGILQSGLWSALRQQGMNVPVWALITDVGNDLIYGVDEDRVVGWVQECLERLPAHARVSLALPPLASIKRLGPLRFYMFVNVLFPGRKHDYDDLVARALRLHDLLQRLAADPSNGRVTAIEPASEWYGFDPIHIRRTHQRSAWATLLEPWGEGPDAEPAARLTTADKARLLCARPESSRWLGLELGQAQPRRIGETQVGLY
ncbi:MAG: hypothetical protein AAF690_26600 [Acidobacteriota bacterium]